jgi:diguanylate cyclase (GGDEF)-like protein
LEEPPRPRADLGAFDEALAGLSAHRPLPEILADILRSAAKALSAPHGFLSLTVDEDAEVNAGIGRWSSAPPADIEREVRERGGALRAGNVAAVPIQAGANVVGALGVAVDPGGSLDAGAIALLGRFGQLAALAHETSRLFDTEREARESAQSITAAARALSVSLSLRDVLTAILRELGNVVPYDTASVQQLQGTRMVIVGGQGIDLDHFLGYGFDALGGRTPNSEVHRTGAPVIVDDILGDHGYLDFPAEAHAMSGVRSWLGVPLMFAGQCTGMITLDKYETGFYNRHHAGTALSFAAQAAIAIENARLYERSQLEIGDRRKAEEELRSANWQLQIRIAEVEALQIKLREQAIRDPLTGLFNRRYLTETLQREHARATRSGGPLALVMMDIDHFKQINDDFGHELGDRVLQIMGALLAELSRGADVACRYGGEEFVILLPDATGAAAAARAEQWRTAIAQRNFGDAERELRVTASIGVAAFPAHAGTPDELLRIADVALYQAKREGRNRVVLAR